MAPLPPAFVHTSPLETLVPTLTQLLPYSLPILRRIQFHFHSPYSVVISTLDPSNPPAVSRVPATSRLPNPTSIKPFPSTTWESTTIPHVSAPFAVLCMDRSRHAETESWIFSTADVPPTPGSPSDAATHGHLLSILSHAWHHFGTSGLSAAAKQPADPAVMIIGGVAQATLRLLAGPQRWDARDHETTRYGWPDTTSGDCAAPGNRSALGVVRGYTLPWVKYVFPPHVGADAQGASSTVQPPKGLAWATSLDARDYDVVVKSTTIPRTPRTLAMMPSRALRRAGASDGKGEDDGGPIEAWVFITPDGSFGALHVQLEFRGAGVARTLLTGLRATITTAGARSEDGGEVERAFRNLAREDAWSHSDTGEQNFAAQKVLASSGGMPSWLCYWGFVDFSKVDEEVERYVAGEYDV